MQNIAQSPDNFGESQGFQNGAQKNKHIPVAKYMQVFFYHHISEWQNTLRWDDFLYNG